MLGGAEPRGRAVAVVMVGVMDVVGVAGPRDVARAMVVVVVVAGAVAGVAVAGAGNPLADARRPAAEGEEGVSLAAQPVGRGEGAEPSPTHAQ